MAQKWLACTSLAPIIIIIITIIMGVLKQSIMGVLMFSFCWYFFCDVVIRLFPSLRGCIAAHGCSAACNKVLKFCSK